ncbi:MAG: hypothetical protein JSS36_05480 [Proteobacteria bacterium]|nr:hypothetical protein [Pseudomonadota bacterium]
MSGFFYAFIAVLLAGFGARDQVLIGHLSAGAANRYRLLVVAVLIGVLTSAIAGYGAHELAPSLTRLGRLLLAALALGLAGLESLLMPRPKAPKEPTLSLAAAAIVFFAHQITDAARLVIFALAVTVGTKLGVAGGVLGGTFALMLGFGANGALVHSGQGLKVLRRLAGVLLLIGAVATWLYAIGRI